MNHHYIWRLRNEHRRLEELLRAERKRLPPDQYVIQDLKRRKLEVKDALFLAECGLVPVSASYRRA